MKKIFLWEKPFIWKKIWKSYKDEYIWLCKVVKSAWGSILVLTKIKYQYESIAKLIDILVCIVFEFSSTYDNIGQLFFLEVLLHL